jgi:hypothetical protein
MNMNLYMKQYENQDTVEGLKIDYLDDGRVICAIGGRKRTFRNFKSLKDTHLLSRCTLVSKLQYDLKFECLTDVQRKMVKSHIKKLHKEESCKFAYDYDRDIKLAKRYSRWTDRDDAGAVICKNYIDRVYSLCPKYKNDIFSEYDKNMPCPFSALFYLAVSDFTISNEFVVANEYTGFFNRLEVMHMHLMLNATKVECQEMFGELASLLPGSNFLYAHKTLLDEWSHRIIVNLQKETTCLFSKIPSDLLPNIKNYIEVPSKKDV